MAEVDQFPPTPLHAKVFKSAQYDGEKVLLKLPGSVIEIALVNSDFRTKFTERCNRLLGLWALTLASLTYLHSHTTLEGFFNTMVIAALLVAISFVIWLVLLIYYDMVTEDPSEKQGVRLLLHIGCYVTAIQALGITVLMVYFPNGIGHIPWSICVFGTLLAAVTIYEIRKTNQPLNVKSDHDPEGNLIVDTKGKRPIGGSESSSTVLELEDQSPQLLIQVPTDPLHEFRTQF